MIAGPSEARHPVGTGPYRANYMVVTLGCGLL